MLYGIESALGDIKESDEKDFLNAVKAGEMERKGLEIRAEFLYSSVIGEDGKKDFQGFLSQLRGLYPNVRDAGIVIAWHIYKASWLLPRDAGKYFTSAREPLGELHDFFPYNVRK